MGVIVPNPTVTEPDGSPVVKNVKEIKVSNGTLTGSGRTATIDTTGSGATPAGSDGDYQKKNGDALAAAILSDDGTSMVKLDPGASASGSVRVLGGKQLTLESSNNAGSAGWQNLVIGGEGDSLGGFFYLQSGKAVTSNQGKFHSSGAGIDAELGAYSSTDTALPKVLCTQGTNGSVSLRPAGTGAVAVVSDGANDPVLQLTSTTKSVELKVNTNQKLSVQGGTDKFVFDVSSASGGITFPDGTTQTTAASAGGSELDSWFKNVAQFTQDDSLVNDQWPLGWDQYGFNSIDAVNWLASYGGMSSSWTYGRDTVVSFPFVALQTGTLSKVVFRNGNSWSGQYMNMALYSDSNGLPDTKLFSWQFDLASAGVVSVTTFTGTASIVAGTRYHLAMQSTMTTGSTHYFGGYAPMFADATGLSPQAAYPQSSWGGSESASYPTRGWALNWDSNSLPASFTATDCKVWPDFGPYLVAVNYELA